MASKRMVRREKKRIQLRQRLLGKRKALREQLNDPTVDIATKFEILAKIENMPRDSSAIRQSRRCKLTGRAHGVYRKFTLARAELRRRAMNGEVPGLVKSSW